MSQDPRARDSRSARSEDDGGSSGSDDFAAEYGVGSADDHDEASDNGNAGGDDVYMPVCGAASVRARHQRFHYFAQAPAPAASSVVRRRAGGGVDRASAAASPSPPPPPAAAASPLLVMTVPLGTEISPDLPLAAWPAHIVTRVREEEVPAAAGRTTGGRGVCGALRGAFGCARAGGAVAAAEPPRAPWAVALARRPGDSDRGAGVDAPEEDAAAAPGWLAIVTGTGVLWRRGARDVAVAVVPAAADGGAAAGPAADARGMFAWGPPGSDVGVVAVAGVLAVVRPPAAAAAAAAGASAQRVPAAVYEGREIVGVGSRIAACTAATGDGDLTSPAAHTCVEVVVLTSDGALRRVHVPGGDVLAHSPGGGDPEGPGSCALLSLSDHHGHVTAMGLDPTTGIVVVAGVEGALCCDENGPGVVRRGGACGGGCGGHRPAASVSVWRILDREPYVLPCGEMDCFLRRLRVRMSVNVYLPIHIKCISRACVDMFVVWSLVQCAGMLGLGQPDVQILGAAAQHACPRARRWQRPRACGSGRAPAAWVLLPRCHGLLALRTHARRGARRRRASMPLRKSAPW
jgi:hypothetical protein